MPRKKKDELVPKTEQVEKKSEPKVEPKKEQPTDNYLALGEIKQAKKIFEKLLDADLPVLESWRFIELIEKVNEVLPRVEIVRIQLVKKYGAVEQGTGQLKVLPENMEAFQNELAEIYNQPFEYKFKPFSLNDFANLTINNRDMMLLKKIGFFKK